MRLDRYGSFGHLHHTTTQHRSIAPSTPASPQSSPTPNAPLFTTSHSTPPPKNLAPETMPSPQSLLAPPPMARTRTARNSLGTTYPLNPVRVSTQPPPRTMMSPTARLPEPKGEQTVDGTLRLRGGCIPCPVRLLSSLSVSTYLPTMSTSTSPFGPKTRP